MSKPQEILKHILKLNIELTTQLIEITDQNTKDIINIQNEIHNIKKWQNQKAKQ